MPPPAEGFEGHATLRSPRNVCTRCRCGSPIATRSIYDRAVSGAVSDISCGVVPDGGGDDTCSSGVDFATRTVGGKAICNGVGDTVFVESHCTIGKRRTDSEGRNQQKGNKATKELLHSISPFHNSSQFDSSIAIIRLTSQVKRYLPPLEPPSFSIWQLTCSPTFIYLV